MRIAVLVKQVPMAAEMTLGADGRLRRDDIELEMNAYCRRAVSRACSLAGEHPGSSVTVFTLGPPAAEDVLREALAWGDEHGVDPTGVLISDPAFAGSDTLATAKALTAALTREGPFDLVLCGRNSIDADTGQVGPEVAELLDWPFMTGVRHVHVDGATVTVRCEHDDGVVVADVVLPAVLSCAERLCEPSKIDRRGRDRVAATRIRRLTAADLGPGPWGQAGSPTWVGQVRHMPVSRVGHRVAGGPMREQVHAALALLGERGALIRRPGAAADGGGGGGDATATVPDARAASSGPVIAVLGEPGRANTTRALLGAAACLAAELNGRVVAWTADPDDHARYASWGADEIVRATGSTTEDDIARGAAEWLAAMEPWAVLAGSTAWGREITSRVAARLGAGLTGDAIDLEVRDGRLVAWKPAFGGQLVAAVGATSAVQMVTVRPGVLPALGPRAGGAIPVTVHPLVARDRVRVRARDRDDDLDVLAEATAVIGIGVGVDPSEYPLLEPLRVALCAELGATRKVTDNGWLPRARQIGITGRSIAPRVFVSIGASGKFNHVVGIRGAGTVLAINSDPAAAIFDAADVGIVGDWRVALPYLVEALEALDDIEGRIDAC